MNESLFVISRFFFVFNVFFPGALSKQVFDFILVSVERLVENLVEMKRKKMGSIDGEKKISSERLLLQAQQRQPLIAAVSFLMHFQLFN